MQGALARHAPAGVDTAARLVNVNGIGVEALGLFLAFEVVLTLDRGHLQLGQQVIGDLLTGVRFKVRQNLNRHLSGLALAHETGRPVALLRGVVGHQASEAFNCLGVIDPDQSTCHKNTPLSLIPKGSTSCAPNELAFQPCLICHPCHDICRCLVYFFFLDDHFLGRIDAQAHHLSALVQDANPNRADFNKFTGANVHQQVRVAVHLHARHVAVPLRG